MADTNVQRVGVGTSERMAAGCTESTDSPLQQDRDRRLIYTG